MQPPVGKINGNNVRKIFESHTYPQHLSNPFNLFNYFHVYNPNMAHITGANPLHAASLAQHPFSSPGMISTITNPYQYLNPMMMGA